MKINYLLLTLFVTILLVQATNDITITSVQTTETQPGKTTDIIVTLENQGDDDIEDISVSLDLVSNDLPFAPEGSTSQKIIEKIKEDDAKTVRFTLVTLSDAKSQIYKIPLILKYSNIEEKTIITLKVNSKPELEVAVEESEIFKIDDQGEIIIRFVNRGLADIKFLTAELITSPDYSLLSASTFYIGNIEPDDFETISFNLRLNNKISFLPVKVTYKDIDNNIYTETRFLDIMIYSEEEAERLGLTKTNYTPLIITPIIVLIILILIIRSIRKRKRAKKLKL